MESKTKGSATTDPFIINYVKYSSGLEGTDSPQVDDFVAASYSLPYYRLEGDRSVVSPVFVRDTHP